MTNNKNVVMNFGKQPRSFDFISNENKDVKLFDFTLSVNSDKTEKLPSGMIKTGVSDKRILEVASSYDAIGITSIFSSITWNFSGVIKPLEFCLTVVGVK